MTANSKCDVASNKNILIQSSTGQFTITRAVGYTTGLIFETHYSGAELTLKNIILDGNSGNNVYSHEGFVLVGSCTVFTMDSGATIQNAKGDAIVSGVYINSSGFGPGVMNIHSGATITNIASKYTNDSDDRFGTILVAGTLNIDGGTITNNKNNHGAIYFSNQHVNLSGSPIISGNTKADGVTPCNIYQGFSAACPLYVTGALTPTTPIGITTDTAPTADTPRNVTGATYSTDLSGCFVSDNPNYVIKNSGSGAMQQVKLTLIPTVMTWADLCTEVGKVIADGKLNVINVTANLTANSRCDIGSSKNILLQSASGTYTITRDTNLIDLSVFDVKNNADLTLKNIILDGNSANFTSNSPLVYAALASFTMDGATIQNAKINSSVSSAGVLLNTGTAIMKNGSKIIGCENISAASNYGGAMFISGTLNIADNCSIKNNRANLGGGVYIYSGGILNLSGSPDISGNTKVDGTTPSNVFLFNGVVVNADALLNPPTPIGITTFTAPTAGAPINITTATNSTDLSGCFVSDNPSYYMRNTGSVPTQQVKLYLIPTVMTWADLCTAVGSASADGALNIINVTADLTADSNCLIDGNKNILIQDTGGTYTITRSTTLISPPVFNVNNSGKLTLKNITLDGNGANCPATSFLIHLLGNAVFTMDSGTLQNSKVNYSNGAAGVGVGTGSTMFMKNGASIRNMENTASYNSPFNPTGGLRVDGTLNMVSGTSISNCKSITDTINSIGGIALYGTLNLNGASVTNNSGARGGIYKIGTLNLSGNPDISGNTKTDGTTPCNVLLFGGGSAGVTVNGTLTNTTPIGISTSPAPTLGSPRNVTAASGTDWSGKFTSDDPSYAIQNSGSGSAQKVQLAVIPFGTVTVKKDNSDWSSGAPNIRLSTQSSSLTGAISGISSSGVYAFTVPDPNQTYYVWDVTNNIYTGQSLSNSGTNATVNYYTISLTSGTGITSVTGSGTYLSGSNVTIFANVTSGYTWSGWTQTTGGALVSTSNMHTIPNVSSPITYTANAVLSGPLPIITTSSLPNGIVGTPYSQSLYGVTTVLPLTWSVSNGTLPSGLTIDSDSGTISGTPTTSGTSNFTVQATNSNGSGTKALSITIDTPYPLTVNLNGGSGSTTGGSYVSGAVVSIDAGTKSGYTFNGWTSSNSGTFADKDSASTTFTMPGNATTITAAWSHNSSGGGGSGSTQPANSNTIVIVDGKDNSIGTENKSGESTIATVDQNKLTEEIAKASEKSSVIFPITTNTKVTAQLVVKNVEDMAKSNMILTVQTGKVAYNLDTAAIDTAKIKEDLGMPDTNVVPFKVTIAGSNAEVRGTSVIVRPVEFTITAEYNGKTVTVDTFSSFVSRTVEITAEQAEQITTAVVVREDGSLRHAPTKVAIIDGKYYAVINSLTNSIYTGVIHHVEFMDAASHWAKTEINDMGSRMVVNGVGNDLYEPDRDITRAEFAAIVVRGLGLDTGMGNNSFTDVRAAEWYYGYIQTAVGYEIINGYGDGTFGPNDTITREQAMTMIARAMKLTKLAPKLTGAQNMTLLSKYTDSSDISYYAMEYVASCTETGVVLGRPDNTVGAKEFITRAEVAVIIRRMLQKSGLI